jgi:hypothetical protein
VGLDRKEALLRMDGIFNVMSALRKRKEQHDLETFALFIDLVKAFDSFSLSLSVAMAYQTIISLHSEAKINIAFSDDKDEADIAVESTIGVRQGSNEGPVLFLFFVQAVFDTLTWPDEIKPLMFMSHVSLEHSKLMGQAELVNVNSCFKKEAFLQMTAHHC